MWICSALLVLLITPPLTAAQADQTPRHVVMISIDGLRPEIYLEPERVGVAVPNLVHLRDHGTSAERMIPVFPSVTYPGHTTLVTGVLPATQDQRGSNGADTPWPYERLRANEG